LPTNTGQIDPVKGAPFHWPMQPMPRTLPGTGFNAIHRATVVVKA